MNFRPVLGSLMLSRAESQSWRLYSPPVAGLWWRW
jgi:hypothetical protein